MAYRWRGFAFIFLITAGLFLFHSATSPKVATVLAAPPVPSPCTIPTKLSSTPEETAWRLFVALNCNAKQNQMVWETWVEQLDLYPASGTTSARRTTQGRHRLHGSPLAAARAVRARGGVVQLSPASECNVMHGPPPNVVSGATICEEARLNPSAAGYVLSHKYQVRSGQEAAAQKGADIQFNTPSIEVKVDWVPASDFNPPFTCSNPPAGVHVETIDGTCYAMGGMHISSKLMKDWLWATFEPQSMEIAPERCITFGPCNDPWGSNPPMSHGGPNGFTQPTAALAALMQPAIHQGKLSPVFEHYRLDGVQTKFTNPNGSPIYLGNSVIEGENVGMTFNTASCITCHSVSSIKNDGTDGISLINDQVGPQFQPPAGYIARDFVWSLALACPNGIQNCTSSSSAVKRKK